MSIVLKAKEPPNSEVKLGSVKFRPSSEAVEKKQSDNPDKAWSELEKAMRAGVFSNG